MAPPTQIDYSEDCCYYSTVLNIHSNPEELLLLLLYHLFLIAMGAAGRGIGISSITFSKYSFLS